MPKKIAVFGATGFLGSALCEQLYFKREFPFVAVIHRFGGAARIARLPIEIRRADLMNRAEIDAALAGCDTVVNCSRGPDPVMLKGFRNLLDAVRKRGIQRFVHISSTAIYGQDPPLESEIETAQPNPGNSAYGATKLRQDEMVQKLHRSGLPAVILCPGNIIGPYSQFVAESVRKLRSREMVLVDEGRYPNNLIHADNLAHSILTVLKEDRGWGERFFINEPEGQTWKQFFSELQRRLHCMYEIPSVSREEVLEAVRKAETVKKESMLKILVSGEFRKALSIVPIFKTLNESAYQRFSSLPTALQDKLRERLERPITIPKEGGRNLSQQFIRVQTRRVFHSPAKLMKVTGYRPLLDQDERMESLIRWLRFANVA